MTDAFAEGREEFAQRGYTEVKGLITAQELVRLRQYHERLRLGGHMKFGDEPCPLRWVAYNEPAARFLHRALSPVMEALVGAPIQPSYTYTACYEAGAELPAHTDREQCEYSVSLCLDFEPEPAGPTPWPLYLTTSTGTVAIRQALGDALFYRGRDIPHYRLQLEPDCRSTSVFLHYVDADFAGSLG
jgi:hypothetical protein